MVGACAALAFARGGRRVGLIEASAVVAGEAELGADYDLRVSAISPHSEQFLQRLGVWADIDHNRVCHYEQVKIWHQHGNAQIDFDALELARNSLGAIVENRQVQRALYQCCKRESGIEWFRPDSIVQLDRTSTEAISIQLESGHWLSADILLAADGRNSPTRALAGFEIQSGSYQQAAVVANVSTEKDHQRIARQRFLSTGPLAFLPLANGQSSIVWSCDDEFAAQVLQADDQEFCRLLSEAFEFSLGDVVATGPRASFQLGWHSCERWLDDRVVLIGDAAHSVHPLAGQGVNLGFSDVELLEDLLSAVDSLWNIKQLRRYQRQRQSETWLAGKSFTALKLLYGSDNPLITSVRDIGMKALGSNPLLKRALMQKAVENIT